MTGGREHRSGGVFRALRKWFLQTAKLHFPNPDTLSDLSCLFFFETLTSNSAERVRDGYGQERRRGLVLDPALRQLLHQPDSPKCTPSNRGWEKRDVNKKIVKASMTSQCLVFSNLTYSHAADHAALPCSTDPNRIMTSSSNPLKLNSKRAQAQKHSCQNRVLHRSAHPPSFNTDIAS